MKKSTTLLVATLAVTVSMVALCSDAHADDPKKKRKKAAHHAQTTSKSVEVNYGALEKFAQKDSSGKPMSHDPQLQAEFDKARAAIGASAPAQASGAWKDPGSEDAPVVIKSRNTHKGSRDPRIGGMDESVFLTPDNPVKTEPLSGGRRAPAEQPFIAAPSAAVIDMDAPVSNSRASQNQKYMDDFKREVNESPRTGYGSEPPQEVEVIEQPSSMHSGMDDAVVFQPVPEKAVKSKATSETKKKPKKKKKKAKKKTSSAKKSVAPAAPVAETPAEPTPTETNNVNSVLDTLPPVPAAAPAAVAEPSAFPSTAPVVPIAPVDPAPALEVVPVAPVVEQPAPAPTELMPAGTPEPSVMVPTAEPYVASDVPVDVPAIAPVEMAAEPLPQPEVQVIKQEEKQSVVSKMKSWWANRKAKTEEVAVAPAAPEPQPLAPQPEIQPIADVAATNPAPATSGTAQLVDGKVVIEPIAPVLNTVDQAIPAALEAVPTAVAAAPMMVAPVAASVASAQEAPALPVVVTTPSVVPPSAPTAVLEAPVAPLASVAPVGSTSATALPANVLAMVNFAKEQVELTATEQQQLASTVEMMKSDPARRVNIISYATSSDAQNSTARRVSLKRALSVRKYLIGQGIDTVRINVQAMGNAAQQGTQPDRVDVLMVAKS